MDRLNIRALKNPTAHRLFASSPLGAFVPRQAAALYSSSAALGFLSAASERPEDLVGGGAVLERLWLSLTREEFAFQPMTGFVFLELRRRLDAFPGFTPIQLSRLNDALGKIYEILPAFKSRTPIMLFRMGKAPEPSARTVRKSLEEMLR